MEGRQWNGEFLHQSLADILPFKGVESGELQGEGAAETWSGLEAQRLLQLSRSAAGSAHGGRGGGAGQRGGGEVRAQERDRALREEA